MSDHECEMRPLLAKSIHTFEQGCAKEMNRDSMTSQSFRRRHELIDLVSRAARCGDKGVEPMNLPKRISEADLAGVFGSKAGERLFRMRDIIDVMNGAAPCHATWPRGTTPVQEVYR